MPPSKKFQGTIAAGHRQTAEAGVAAYQQGGNAIDAAISALFASCVTEPCMSGFGGGGFAIVRTRDQVQVLDFFCQTPARIQNIDALDFVPVEVNFSETTEVFHVGKGAVAVPGMVDGIFALLDRYGTLPVEVLAQPAINLAKSGADVDWFQEYDFQLLESIFSRGPDSAGIFYRDGSLLKQGDIIRNPVFAQYLEAVVADGPELFYQGETARAIAEQNVDGGMLTRADLKAYSANWRTPLTVDCQMFKIHTNPAPGRGGIMIGKTLRELALAEKPAPVFGSGEYTRNMLEAILSGTTQSGSDYAKWGSTTHISTVDSVGNAVSVSVSNGEGSGCFIPNTGIQMNNMLGEAALFPNGLHSWHPDSRVQSLMSPTVMESNNQLIALGTGGAGRIPSAISQVIYHLAIDGTEIDEAIQRGRIFSHGNTLEIEPGIESPSELPIPLSKVNRWARNDMFFGGVHVAAMIDGLPGSHGDARRNGAVADF